MLNVRKDLETFEASDLTPRARIFLKKLYQEREDELLNMKEDTFLHK